MLPAPIIEGTLPAFYSNVDGAATLTVPYSMSRAVSDQEVNGFYIKIKSIISNKILYNEKSSNNVFIIPSEVMKDKFKKGNFYKVQLAYIDKNDQVGYYSTVGVIKYTTKPDVSIEGLSIENNNVHKISYTGRYSQIGGDITEKEYSYRFEIKEPNGNVIADTGFIIHNSSNNEAPDNSYDTFDYVKELEGNKRYTIQYSIRTNNGLEISSEEYSLIEAKTLADILQGEVVVTNNFENGCINIKFKGNEVNGKEALVTGAFKILRSTKENNFKDWQEFTQFALGGEIPSSKSWTDYTVEQGVEYMYAIQQYNKNGVYSNRLETKESVMADFEDNFLYDGTRQLKIKFNPKVSSFKHTQLESKMETIGSKYPFFFKNGNVGYKEFPISGLLSYLLDDQNMFFNNEELYDYKHRKSTSTRDKDIPQYASTNLDTLNFQKERDFKLEVLQWLNNGEPKLFRSPSEGNYIVRLMNVSLTPNDTLSRMIHTFNATAYEVAENTYEQQIKHNFITASRYGEKINNDLKVYRAWSVNLDKYTSIAVRDYVYINVTAKPGTKIDIQLKGENQWASFIVGSTGAFKANIEFSDLRWAEGSLETLTIGYYESIEKEDNFQGISSVSYHVRLCHQIIGENKDIIAGILAGGAKNGGVKAENETIVITSLDKIRFYKRPDVPSDEIYYELQISEDEDINYNIIIDDLKLNLNDVNYLEYNNFDTVPSMIFLGNGVYAELFYSYQILTKGETKE